MPPKLPISLLVGERAGRPEGVTERDLCENPMTQRYATIITDEGGREIVSAIGEFEGAAPQGRLGRVEPVAPGVRIGMVRDGAGNFAFPEAATGGQMVNLAIARLKALRPVATAKPAQPAKPKAAKRRKMTARPKKPTGQARSQRAAGAGGEGDGVAHARD